MRTADPTPTHGHVQAFLLASTDLSFDDLQAHYQQIGVVYPTYFNCGTQGKVTGQDDPLVTGWASARQIAVMPRLNCQNPGDETEILTNSSVEETFIGNLASLCEQYGYQGIQIDFEGAPPSDREPFTKAFITALAARLHALGDKLSTIVTAKYCNIHSGRAAMYDDAALSVPSDYISCHWVSMDHLGARPIDEMAWFGEGRRMHRHLAQPQQVRARHAALRHRLEGCRWLRQSWTALEFSNVTRLPANRGYTQSGLRRTGPWFTYTMGEGSEHTVW